MVCLSFQDCFQWAKNTNESEQQLDVPGDTLERFRLYNGMDLYRFDEEDFCLLVGYISGPLFYDHFQNLCASPEASNCK